MMAALSIFGLDLSIQAGGSVQHQVPGLSARFTLDAAATQLALDLDGRSGAVTFQAVQASAPCVISNGRVVMQENLNLASTGTITLQIGPGSFDATALGASVQGDVLRFKHDASLAGDLAQIPGHPLSGLLSFERLQYWTTSLLELDLLRGTAELLAQDDRPRALLRDQFGGMPTSARVDQFLRILGVRLGSASPVLLLAPRTGALFLNADILDPTAELDAFENGLLFQHVVAEARLEADLAPIANGWQIPQWWAAPVTERFVLAAPSLKDEHGHPLILSVGARVPVAKRTGALKPERTGRLNQALVLGFADKAFETGVELISIDPIEAYASPRLPGDLEADRTLKPPYWLRDTRALSSPRRPHEVAGWSSNGAIRTGGSHERGPLPCVLSLNPVRLPATDLLFVEATLSFETSAMQLLADLPERSTLLRTGDAAPPMRRYRAQGNGRQVALPLCDIRWALADLAGPQQDPAVQPLATTVQSWPTRLDAALRQGFDATPDDAYTHTEGHRASGPSQPFARLIAAPPATTMRAGRRLAAAFMPGETELARPDTAKTGSTMGARTLAEAATSVRAAMAPAKTAFASTTPATAFLFGGSRNQLDIHDAALLLDDARSALAPHIESFFAFWAGHDVPAALGADPWPARRALRKYLVGEPSRLPEPEDWTGENLVEASARLETASAMLGRSPPGVLGFEEYSELLDGAMPDEVAELRDPASENGILSRLFQYAFAPPSLDVLKRAAAAIWSEKPADVLAQHMTVLQQVVGQELVTALKDRFAGALKPSGLIAELLQGLSPLIAQVELIWRDHKSFDTPIVELFDDLNSRYGPLFTPEVYAAVLADEIDAAALLEALRDIGLPLTRLADLSFEPPDYLVISRRTRNAGVAGDTDSLHPVDRIAALWNHRFDFCNMGTGKAWDMFLDDDTTLIVKLGGERSLDAILAEAHQAYAAPGRPDPFGLALSIETNDPVAAFLGQLAGELREPAWRGVLIVNPTIDLGRDPAVSTLCGLPHIAGLYAAVGGHTPTALKGVDLDIWGRIERHALPESWTDAQGSTVPGWGSADVGWSLTKFDATIRNTTILSGEIAFQLDVVELFGRRDLGRPKITVSGVLRALDAPTSGAARDFTFGATFETPCTLKIDVAFLKELQLRGIRVGSHDGATTLDIDADLACREWKFMEGVEFEPPDGPVRLSDFRIRLPAVADGLSIPMGIRRALAFDLGAIRFPVTKERQLRIAGLEIKPVGIGMIRDQREAILQRLSDETMPGVVPDMPNPGRYAYPYLDTRISFGNGPELGGGGQLGLVARAGVPVSDPGTTPHGPGLGIASLEGRNLELSLFRLMTISADKVVVKVIPLLDPDSGVGGSPAVTTPEERVGVVSIKNFNLRLLSWSLFDKNDDRQLIFAQKTQTGGGRGMLAWYASGSEPTGFFRLHWLLLTRNFDPGEEVLHALITPGTAADVPKERQVIAGILSPPPDQRLRARIRTDDPWLFGIRFDLGELFKPCALVLHDKHYYGIRLGGLVPKMLTGEEELNFAYIPGPEPALDRFRTSFRCAAFDLLAEMRSGVMALEWSPCWDFLIDCGQPWRGPQGYAWERAFSMPVGTYEAKFGFFIERRTSLAPPPFLPANQGKYVTFSAGAGFYLGYRFELSAGIAWVRAGIGVFGVLIGSATLKLPRDADAGNPLALLKGSLAQFHVVGVVGIYAYGEGGVDVWILSARFRVSAQAFVEVTLSYVPSGRSMIAWDAMLSAHYSASVRVGSGWFSWTFSVSGAVEMRISGRAAFG